MVDDRKPPTRVMQILLSLLAAMFAGVIAGGVSSGDVDTSTV